MHRKVIGLMFGMLKAFIAAQTPKFSSLLCSLAAGFSTHDIRNLITLKREFLKIAVRLILGV